MPKKYRDVDDMPEIFRAGFYSSKHISALLGCGKIRKIAPLLYTCNISDNIETIVRRHLWRVVGLLYPGAVISERTAVEMRVADDGSIFVVSNKKRPTTVGDITIRPSKGAVAQPSDMPFVENLFLASPPRIILENTAPSRAKKGIARRLSSVELEEYLDNIIKNKGEEALLKLRDEMRKLAPKLDMQNEFELVNKLIATLLQTRNGKLVSEVGIARAQGFPYDTRRVELFSMLYSELESSAPVIRIGRPSVIMNFFEAYFSNFIEGTEFAVSEAEEIVFKNIMPQNRPEDAHDIKGTFDIVSSENEMKKTPKTFDDFMHILKSRHAILMAGRPEKMPGVIKNRVNVAGASIFVNPDLVTGTLKKGFEIYQKLSTPFSKAVFMMFLLTEVHPFDDGNGRIGRVMMNAELVTAGEQRIIIPTVYRNYYIIALKAMSKDKRAAPILRTLDFAQKYTGAIKWDNIDVAVEMLTQTNAFDDPNLADETGVRLMLPSRVVR